MIDCILTLCIAASPIIADQNRDSIRTPQAAVGEAISLLERRQFLTFLERFVAPDVLKKMTTGTTIENVAADFERQKARLILSMLKEAAKSQPEMVEDGRRANYRFQEPIGGQTVLILRQIGDSWRIQ